LPDRSRARTVADDEALISATGGGDADAFAELVSRYLDTIHAYLARMTGSSVEAEDLTQETFLRVWRRAGSYRPGRVRPTTWLHSIAHNLCVDAFRRAGSRPSQGAHAELDELTVDELADPARHGSAQQELERVQAALAELPHNQRAAVILCLVEGRSSMEAATIIGVGRRAVESLLARARRALRQALAVEAHRHD
jgi:RNA polymerase sigma-70 factor (ECF subfamily)